jgi:hypothetical protein
MPTHLNKLETLLYRLITAVSGVAEGLAAERDLASGLDRVVLGDDRLSAEARVDIYANMYFYRILDALKEDFPATLAVLGDDNFHNLVTGYILEYPPTEPSISECGSHLPSYLRDHPLRESAPFAADLARLERSIVEVFQGPEISALEADREWKPAEPGAVQVLVWRHNSRVFHRDLESPEAGALEAISRGTTFAEICDIVASNPAAGDDDPVAAINRMLARWLSDSLVTRG